MKISTKNRAAQLHWMSGPLSWVFFVLCIVVARPDAQARATREGTPQQAFSPLYPYVGPVYIELTAGAGAVDIAAFDAAPTLRAFPASAPAGLEPWRDWRYQWLLNGEAIPGQTAATLTVTQTGRYSLQISYIKYENTVVRGTRTSEEVNVYPGQSYMGQPLTYTASTSVFTPGITQPSQLASLAVKDKIQVANLVDGFSRPKQTQIANAAPDNGDIIKFQVYDYMGEATRQYLPYVRATANGAVRFGTQPRTELGSFYNGSTPTVAADTRPYDVASSELSPLMRPQSYRQTGAAWISSSYVQYETNTASSVHRWVELDGSAFYAAGTLAKVSSENEDGRRSEEYRDEAGRVVLTRQLISGGALETYNVYNEAGQLRFVIPPAAVAALDMRGSFVISPATELGFIQRWLYEYQYDEKGRLVSRQVPGADPVFFVYDRFDRLVLTQDGNRRARNEWYCTKFDAQGRAAEEGIYTDGRGQVILQTEADDWGTQPGQHDWERRQNTGNYTLTESFPSAGSFEGLSINWYDDYDLDLNGTPDAGYAYTNQASLAAADQPVQASTATGLPTVTLRRVVRSDGTLDQWLRTALFYDRYGNVIQKKSSGIIHDLTTRSPLLPDVTTVVYRQHGFVPQVQQTITAQQSDFGSITVRNRFAYDHAGRIQSIWQQNQRGSQPDPEVLVGRYAYNALGQLVEKNLHSQDEGRSFLQSVDLRYDIHGQLVSFNNSQLQPGTNNDDTNDLFGFSLNRQQADPELPATPRFDGGITSMRWQAHNPVQQNQPERERGYTFGFDEVGRLTNAHFSAHKAGAPAGFTEEVGAYDEQMVYGPNGNITNLTRQTQPTASAQSQYLLDKLQYAYGPEGGNQLRAVDDAGDAQRGFHDLVQQDDEYEYDANGNLVRDDNKGLLLEHNVLNKVSVQSTSDGGQIVSDFDANGNLVRRVVKPADGPAITYYYVDGFIYQESRQLTGLAALPTPEGRVLAVTTGPPTPYELQPAAGPTIPPTAIPVPGSSQPAQPIYEGPPRLVY